MIVDACRRLERIAPLSTYGYVGFGALEFVDFDLFHRHLGITQMTSIERDLGSTERYEFNRPYRDVQLLFGEATEHLPTLDWTGLRIVWLDYECQLRESELRDCAIVVRELQPGSVLLVTLNAHSRLDGRLELLRQNVGETRLSAGLTEEALSSEWAFAGVQRAVLTDYIQEIASLRPTPVNLRQFVNFNYKDSARMQTLGWVVSSPGLDKTVAECLIENLEVSRTGEDPMVIKLPVLTRREAQYLNARLPVPAGQSLAETWLDRRSQAEYAGLYRWYPSPV
jgi:hypothetical protein